MENTLKKLSFSPEIIPELEPNYLSILKFKVLIGTTAAKAAKETPCMKFGPKGNNI
jgi:hypothetical protein